MIEKQQPCDSTQRRLLHLVVGWSVALAIAIGLQRLLQPAVGPQVVLVSFLVLPTATTLILGEWWTVLSAPLIYWGSVWIPLWLSRYIFLEDKWPIVLLFTMASFASSILGIGLRRFGHALLHR